MGALVRKILAKVQPYRPKLLVKSKFCCLRRNPFVESYASIAPNCCFASVRCLAVANRIVRPVKGFWCKRCLVQKVLGVNLLGGVKGAWCKRWFVYKFFVKGCSCLSTSLT